MFNWTKSDEVIACVIIACFPLGLWKAVELLVWVCHHLRWSA